jgi:hypothetical protein
MQVQNGHFRNKDLVIDYQVNENSLPDFPKTYHITDSFGEFPALTDQELRELSDEDYQTRLAAFITYIEYIHPDFDLSSYTYLPGEEPYGENTTLCPIGDIPS